MKRTLPSQNAQVPSNRTIPPGLDIGIIFPHGTSWSGTVSMVPYALSFTDRAVREAPMPRRTLPVFGLLAATILASAATVGTNSASEVVAHEWGTFTTVAGEDGQAISWLPLGGPTDLPCFV